ncbi:MAG: hypothetical protein ABI380_13205 [Edaphobacter sp.]
MTSPPPNRVLHLRTRFLASGAVHLYQIVVPLAAFIAVLPLILHGCSCGHDFDFHLLNWMEAARQFSHGNLHPHWAYTPAFNAGEPRFVFYPPLSWTIGAILSFLMPWTWTPIAYTWLALTAAGFGLYRLAREFTTPTAALLAAAFYLVNPYTLFTAYERTAYAELLAAAWIPLLLHAILREKVTIPRIAVPVALLWLTNVPAAIMGCYALAFLTLIRLFVPPATEPDAPSPTRSLHLRWASYASATSPAQLILNTTVGTLLGFGIAAFYIVPAAYERRYIQISKALTPGTRIQDNFLFHHTADISHDAILHTASVIALSLLGLAAVALLIAFLRRIPQPDRQNPKSRFRVLYVLAILVLAIAFLLTSFSSFLWNHLPELVFLQFPWRLLALLAAALGLAIAIALTPVKIKPGVTAFLSLTLVLVLTFGSYHVFHQFCFPEDAIAARLSSFLSNGGSEPYNEYTPIPADNDSLSQANPPYWFLVNPDSDPNGQAPPHSITGSAPSTLSLSSATPRILVLNLRDYPAWRITLNHATIATRLQRDDGLIAFPIPAGLSRITVSYTHTLDQTIGDILTFISVALLMLTVRRKAPFRDF